MKTTIKMPGVCFGMESSPRIKKKANGSSSLSVSRGVMKTADLVAVTKLHLHEIFA
jgi:hypothetical protein